jgi:fatty acid desaturase
MAWRNESNTEMMIRVVGGLVLLALAAFGVLTGGWAWAAWIVGAIGVVTGAVGFCPAWHVLGIRTHHPATQTPAAHKAA